MNARPETLDRNIKYKSIATKDAFTTKDDANFEQRKLTLETSNQINSLKEDDDFLTDLETNECSC